MSTIQSIRSRASVRLFAAVLVLTVTTPALLRAQSEPPAGGEPRTRAELIALAQAEKARRLQPYELTAVERVIARVETALIEPGNGFFPVAGSVLAGGGLALGAGYRRWYADDAAVQVTGLYSMRNYKQLDVRTSHPGHAMGPVALELYAGWRDATQVGYYGLGMATSRRDRSNYRFRQTYAGGRATFRPLPWAVLAGGTAFEDYRLDGGQGRVPSIETRHSPATAPGLGVSPRFVHSDVTAAVDWRASPGYTRHGGYYGVTLHDYSDIDDALSFRRLDADAVQHLPVLRETWVLSLRARMQTTLGDDDVVPYFLLPSLGGGSTLRGYASWRFRDRHSLLGSAEWRWIPNRLALDVALYYDVGKVAASRRDLDLTGLERNAGIGVRFHGPTTTPLRFDLARGSEGWSLVVTSGAAF